VGGLDPRRVAREPGHAPRPSRWRVSRPRPGCESARLGTPFAELAARVVELLSGAVIVAHGAKWDVSFLEAELLRAGRPTQFPFYLDTLVLARRSFAFRSYSLTALAKELGISHEGAHRAEADVAALRALFLRCIQVLAPVSVRDSGRFASPRGAPGRPFLRPATQPSSIARRSF